MLVFLAQVVRHPGSNVMIMNGGNSAGVSGRETAQNKVRNWTVS